MATQHKEDKSMKYYVLASIIMVSAVAYTMIYDNNHPMQCVASSKVVDILTLEYRDATIKLENGQVVRVNQATLKKGDDYCLKYERK
jgi:hypothetical protein